MFKFLARIIILVTVIPPGQREHFRGNCSSGKSAANCLVGAAWPFPQAVLQWFWESSSPARVATWCAFEVPWGHVSPLIVK